MVRVNKPKKTYLDAVVGSDEEYQKNKRVWVRYNLMKKIYEDRISNAKACHVGRLEKRFLYISHAKDTCYGDKMYLYYDEGLKSTLQLKTRGLHDFWDLARSRITMKEYQEQVESEYTYPLCSCHYRIFMLHNPFGEICIHNGRVKDPDHYGMSLSAQVSLYEPYKNSDGFIKLLKSYFPQYKRYHRFLDAHFFCAECGFTVQDAFAKVETHYDLLFFPYKNSVYQDKAVYKWRGRSKKPFVDALKGCYIICLKCHERGDHKLDWDKYNKLKNSCVMKSVVSVENGPRLIDDGVKYKLDEKECNDYKLTDEQKFIVPIKQDGSNMTDKLLIQGKDGEVHYYTKEEAIAAGYEIQEFGRVVHDVGNYDLTQFKTAERVDISGQKHIKMSTKEIREYINMLKEKRKQTVLGYDRTIELKNAYVKELASMKIDPKDMLKPGVISNLHGSETDVRMRITKDTLVYDMEEYLFKKRLQVIDDELDKCWNGIPSDEDREVSVYRDLGVLQDSTLGGDVAKGQLPFLEEGPVLNPVTNKNTTEYMDLRQAFLRSFNSNFSGRYYPRWKTMITEEAMLEVVRRMNMFFHGTGRERRGFADFTEFYKVWISHHAKDIDFEGDVMDFSNWSEVEIGNRIGHTVKDKLMAKSLFEYYYEYCDALNSFVYGKHYDGRAYMFIRNLDRPQLMTKFTHAFEYKQHDHVTDIVGGVGGRSYSTDRFKSFDITKPLIESEVCSFCRVTNKKVYNHPLYQEAVNIYGDGAKDKFQKFLRSLSAVRRSYLATIYYYPAHDSFYKMYAADEEAWDDMLEIERPKFTSRFHGKHNDGDAKLCHAHGAFIRNVHKGEGPLMSRKALIHTIRNARSDIFQNRDRFGFNRLRYSVEQFYPVVSTMSKSYFRLSYMIAGAKWREYSVKYCSYLNSRKEYEAQMAKDEIPVLSGMGSYLNQFRKDKYDVYTPYDDATRFYMDCFKLIDRNENDRKFQVPMLQLLVWLVEHTFHRLFTERKALYVDGYRFVFSPDFIVQRKSHLDYFMITFQTEMEVVIKEDFHLFNARLYNLFAEKFSRFYMNRMEPDYYNMLFGDYDDIDYRKIVGKGEAIEIDFDKHDGGRFSYAASYGDLFMYYWDRYIEQYWKRTDLKQIIEESDAGTIHGSSNEQVEGDEDNDYSDRIERLHGSIDALLEPLTQSEIDIIVGDHFCFIDDKRGYKHQRGRVISEYLRLSDVYFRAREYTMRKNKRNRQGIKTMKGEVKSIWGAAMDDIEKRDKLTEVITKFSDNKDDIMDGEFKKYKEFQLKDHMETLKPGESMEDFEDEVIPIMNIEHKRALELLNKHGVEPDAYPVQGIEHEDDSESEFEEVETFETDPDLRTDEPVLKKEFAKPGAVEVPKKVWVDWADLSDDSDDE